MVQPRKYLLIFALTVLITAALACSLPGARRPGQKQPEPLPVTTEEADQLEDNLEEAADAYLSGKPFTLSITETQVTSLVTLKLQSIGEKRLQNLQIYLRDGQIQIIGDALYEGISLPINIAARVSASQGSLALEILEARVGVFNVPESLLDQLQAQLDQIILEQLSPDVSKVVIEDISIANGVMTITGHAS